jgi:serine protease inhibitor
MRRLMIPLLAAALLAGCGASTPSGGGADVAMSNVAKLAAATADGVSAGSAVNAFGLGLYRAVAAGSTGNLVLSPASIAVALSMARAGARGTTAAEMDAVLHGLGSDEHAAWLASLDAALNARTGSFPDAGGKPQDVTLRLTDAAFAQRGLTLQAAYLDALASRLGAGLRLVDYKSAAEAARVAINAWVADQTEQRIRELLAKGTLDSLTRLVLVNAIYLKAAWQTPFSESATAPATFTRLDGTTVGVPMMHLTGELAYATGTGWQAVELPYVGGRLAMDVIVPDDAGAFEASFDGATYASIVDGLAPASVILGLPTFKAETHVSLGEVLAAMGMPTAFTGGADFSGITKDEALQITAVVHQANIDVDEKGTTAAAATAVVMGKTAIPGKQVTLTVDHPFLFALRDLETGAVLFLGRIADPAAAAG